MSRLSCSSKRFLCITPADLEDYVQHCLTANDRAHLAYKIQALRHSTTPPYQGDQGPSAGYDGYNRNQRGSPAQTNPTDSRPFHSLPQHGHAYANHRTPTHRTAYSPPPNSRDYNKIRPVIPERTSSNTTEITRILESLNYEMPTIRHIGSLGRGRTLSSYPRTHMASTRPSFYDPAADAPQAPVAAQAQANDQASYWKWARKYIPQPIQVNVFLLFFIIGHLLGNRHWKIGIG
ncbi:hypothetical protein BDF14DRAFT_1109761 [Spinellus fusiger]|nr:hypothetical protein BDF14DRAFT_1109761 [Spinellus fusiger]